MRVENPIDHNAMIAAKNEERKNENNLNIEPHMLFERPYTQAESE